MEDIIIIGGYTLEELKKVQAGVKKDASKIIADNIKIATDKLDELLSFAQEEAFSDEQKEEIKAKAKVAGEALELVDLVSGISGVSYYLPYSSEYDSDGYFYQFESADDGQELFELIDAHSKVFGKLEDMEYQSRQWHQSNC